MCSVVIKLVFALVNVALSVKQTYFDLIMLCFRYSELTEVQQQLIRETLITWLQAQVSVLRYSSFAR